MKKAGIWFLLSCKRYGRRLSFLLILLLLPLLCLALRPSGGEKTPAIRIAVCALGGQEGQLGGRLLADLTGPEREEGMFRFYLCPDEQQLKDEVASRRAECGFVIGEALEEKLNQKDYKRCISIYSAPSTVTAALAGEVAAGPVGLDDLGGGVTQRRADLVDLDLVDGPLLALFGVVRTLTQTALDDDAHAALQGLSAVLRRLTPDVAREEEALAVLPLVGLAVERTRS